MSKLHFRLLGVCALFFSGCIGSVETTTATLIPITPSMTPSPSQTLTPAPTITIATVLPNPTVSSDVTLPALFYILDNKVYEQVSDPPGNEIADLTDDGPILAAFQSGEVLLVMREQGIQRIKLSDGTTDIIFSFDIPAMYGEFVYARDGQNIFFTTAVDDPQAEFGTANKVGFYDLNLDTITPVITIPDRIRILGQTEDNLGLYLLFFGMDTALGRIFLVDIQKGEIVQELAFQGELIASLAPDGNHLATMNPSNDPVESTLGVYDLTSSPGTPPLTSNFRRIQALSPVTFYGRQTAGSYILTLCRVIFGTLLPLGQSPMGYGSLN